MLPALEHLGPFCHLVCDQGLGWGEGFGFSLWHAVVNVLRALTEREKGGGGGEGGREGGRKGGGGVGGGGERERNAYLANHDSIFRLELFDHRVELGHAASPKF